MLSVKLSAANALLEKVSHYSISFRTGIMVNPTGVGMFG